MADDCSALPAPEQLSHSGGWGILLGCLAFFAIVAGLGVPFVTRSLRSRGISAKSAEGTDFWYTARNSQGWPSIAFSICATSAGGWLLYTPAEAAVLGGWWALLGYCVAIALGPLVMCYLAPKFREQMTDSANITDWVLQRFGVVPFIYVTLCLVYYMFIYLVGQLKTMGDMTLMFTGMKPEAGIIPLAVVTMLYTGIGGFPASIVTDWVQAGCILVFVFGVCIAIWGWVDVKQEHWEQVSVWSDRGFEMAVSLCFAVFGAEVLNLAFWQRIYAARDVKQLRIGFVVGALMVSVLTFIFGLTGMLLKANDLGRSCPRNPIAPFIFFQVLDLPGTGDAIRVLLYILVVCMIASNADSFQTAITSTISRALQQRNWPAWKNIAVAELFVLTINVPAILFAIFAANDVNENFDGLAVKLTDLFGMADILTITLVVPLFAGLWPFMTIRGAMAGMLTGIIFIMVWGWMEFHTFMGGMEMITLMCFGNIKPPPSDNGAPSCGLYSSRASHLFPLLPLITGIAAFAVAFADRAWGQLMEITSKLPDGDRMKLGDEQPEKQEQTEKPAEQTT